MRRRVGIQDLALHLTLLLAAPLGCTERNEYQPPPPPDVTVANPVQATVEDVLEVTGETIPHERIEIRARVEGYLEEAPFTEGAMVEQGQPLFIIDKRPFQAAVDAAKAAELVAEARVRSAEAVLKQAQAQAANDQAQYNRAARAAQAGGVTQAELDELRTTYQNSVAEIDVAQASIESAKAEVEAAKATVRQEELDLSYTDVTSPIAGRVGKRQVDLGNLVGSGESTVLTNVIAYDPIYATFTISEAELLKFQRQAEASGDAPGPKTRDENDRPILLGLADEEGYPHVGRFDYADLALDRATGTYFVRAEFPNPGLSIPPGAFVRIAIPRKEEEALLLPDEAIGRDQNGAYVSVVEADNKVARKAVETAGLYDGKRVIKQGLTPEDRVVVNGLQMAQPGAVVNPIEASASGPPESEDAAPRADS
ncbi:Efflux pump periplasmic linker BepF [Posidoniimonas corsicana]|uniref:Efflux pump periplasmic linker BepF n=1 Tax=Posidoniimonas corsicana TaxID=1938618 RepID=A0A5C5UVN6_9BACT|nr:efflux RND transporter periplasmic adaptor subunit [Posidoniimonas corsicana]TWT30434.1 Efflux pump periplasmic linker BepF [Posidoniimonas corsicana]